MNAAQYIAPLDLPHAEVDAIKVHLPFEMWTRPSRVFRRSVMRRYRRDAIQRDAIDHRRRRSGVQAMNERTLIDQFEDAYRMMMEIVRYRPNLGPSDVFGNTRLTPAQLRDN